MNQVPDNVELQPLKWVLAKKTNTVDESKNRYRYRNLSTSYRSDLRHSVHGNDPTVILSTLRMLASILLSWIQLSLKISPINRIIISCRHVHKAFIQSLKSQCLIIYKQPEEFLEAYHQLLGEVWKELVSWNQFLQLRLKSPCGSAVDSIGLTARGPGSLDRTSSKGATHVEVCGCQLYAYVKISVYKSQSPGRSVTYVRSAD